MAFLDAASRALHRLADAIRGDPHPPSPAPSLREKVGDAADAVGSSAALASGAPRRIAAEVREGIRDVAPEVAKTMLGFSLTFVLAATAYVVFAIWLVVALNALLGDPLGALVAALLLGAGAAAAVAWGRASLGHAAKETRETAADVQEEAAFVARPVVRELGGEGARPGA